MQKTTSGAHNLNVPFTAPAKPLSQLRLAVVTTTSPAGTSTGDVARVWSRDAAVVPNSMFTDNLAWDKETTNTDDTETFLPLRALQSLVNLGELGSLAPRYHGVPSEYSQRQTLENDAPELLERLRVDGADGALLVPL